MRKHNLELVLAWTAASNSKVAECVRASQEVGVVVPSILRAKLIEAGLEVRDEKFKDGAQTQEWKVLKQVTVWDGDKLIAMGASGDPGDALLHAILGYARENPA